MQSTLSQVREPVMHVEDSYKLNWPFYYFHYRNISIKKVSHEAKALMYAIVDYDEQAEVEATLDMLESSSEPAAASKWKIN